MTTVIKHAVIEKGFGPAVESSRVKNYDNDPLVVKKVTKAVETLKKVGLPDTTKK